MKFDMTFIGTSTPYSVVDGSNKERIHLDGAASPLAAKVAIDTINKLLPHYSNSHSYVHNSAMVSTKAFNWAHNTILNCVNASNEKYTAVFMGSGTTAASNRLARGLASSRAEKEIIMISSMEHHANDLPHRKSEEGSIIYIPLQKSSNEQSESLGTVDLIEFEKLCIKHSQNINYVAVSSVSNVTGICNPIREMAEIAHNHGALILVDAAQSVAHMQSNVETDDIDFLIFSGHKVYTPMSPGVLVAKRNILSTLSGQDLGGGSVSDVSFYDYSLFNQFPDREQSGTPNIVGSVALASVFKKLYELDFNKIYQHSTQLTKQLIDGLSSIRGITIYGDIALPRVGAISFNHSEIDHGLLAAILNDYFAIAVRNECFCAHPYVSALLKEQLWSLNIDHIPEEEQEAYINRKRGMVRASISLYTSKEDIEKLLTAIEKIIKNINEFKHQYNVNNDGTYQHKTHKLDWNSLLAL